MFHPSVCPLQKHSWSVHVGLEQEFGGEMRACSSLKERVDSGVKLSEIALDNIYKFTN